MRKGTGNTGESSRLVTGNCSEDMRAFDALPKEIRQAIAAAPYEYAASQIHDAYIEARRSDPWFHPSDFRRDMEYNFRQDVIQMSTTGTEYNGNYKLTAPIHEKSSRHRYGVRSGRVNRASRHGVL